MSTNSETQKSAKSTTAKNSKGFTAAEKAAMKERAKEMKAEQDKAGGEADALAKIAEMHGSDQTMAQRLHAIIKTHAPTLSAKTYYGMPSYANEDGKVVCFFKPAEKFGARYATFEFNDTAHLDDGDMWPISYALKQLTATEEAKIIALLKKALG
jgi:uncharacterized protein YdhG (YjbR/CyaY superfamily)